MLAGLTIYVLGAKHLPPEVRAAHQAAMHAAPGNSPCKTYLLLFAIGLAVTVFRGAYEQVGNTVALWADVGINRATALMTIPMTWFQALNPLLVIVMTPPLLARWRQDAAARREQSSMCKMATGAMIVAAAYLLLAIVASVSEPSRASWGWLALFFVIFTLGELYILPTGLGLFARLAPARFGATTVAAWFLAIFSGSLTAGVVGALWSRTTHARFFVLLAVIALAAAAMLLVLDPLTRRIEAARAVELTSMGAVEPEFS